MFPSPLVPFRICSFLFSLIKYLSTHHPLNRPLLRLHLPLLLNIHKRSAVNFAISNFQHRHYQQIERHCPEYVCTTVKPHSYYALTQQMSDGRDNDFPARTDASENRKMSMEITLWPPVAKGERATL